MREEKSKIKANKGGRKTMRKNTIALSLIIGLVASVSGAVGAVQAQEAVPVETPAAVLTTVTSDMAQSFIAAAKARAEDAGWQMSFAVVDNFGRPVAMVRMDGARWMTPQIAHSKAFTSATFGRPSASVAEFAEGRQQLYKSVQKVIGEPLLPAGGGLPILIDGKLLGGVGASGATQAEDIEAARAGLDAIGAE